MTTKDDQHDDTNILYAHKTQWSECNVCLWVYGLHSFWTMTAMKQHQQDLESEEETLLLIAAMCWERRKKGKRNEKSGGEKETQQEVCVRKSTVKEQTLSWDSMITWWPSCRKLMRLTSETSPGSPSNTVCQSALATDCGSFLINHFSSGGWGSRNVVLLHFLSYKACQRIYLMEVRCTLACNIANPSKAFGSWGFVQTPSGNSSVMEVRATWLCGWATSVMVSSPCWDLSLCCLML